MDVKSKIERIDRWQQHRSWAALPMATLKKFKDDHTTNLAGLIAFWAFFSIFPLMLVFITVLGYVVPSDVKGNVLARVGDMLPVIKGQNFSGLSGTWWALVVGAVSALWSGMAVVRTTQSAFDSVWEVPVKERAGLVSQSVRSLKVLFTIGAGLIISTVISGFVSGATSDLGVGPIGIGAGYAISLALDIGIFIAAFRMLTGRSITTKQVVPGAVLSGVVFWIFQLAASLIIGRYLRNAQGTYGQMAGVITMLWWFYLQAIVTLLGCQLNVVLTHRLWPRSLVGGPDTPADHTAYSAYARERTYHDNERVDTTFVPQSEERRR